MWTAAKYNVVFLGLTGVAFLIFAPTIIGWFTPDPDVRAVGTHGLRTMSLGFPFFALGMVLEQSFNGAGDTLTPTYLNASSGCFRSRLPGCSRPSSDSPSRTCSSR